MKFKKGLMVLGSLSLLPTTTLSGISAAWIQGSENITTFNHPDKAKGGRWAVNDWASPVNGHGYDHNSWNIYGTKYTPSYDLLMEDTHYIIINGWFNWGTKYTAKTKDSITVTRVGENGVFNFEEDHQAKNGWGHQQANIKIDVLIKKDDNGKAYLFLEMWVEVASQASVNNAHVDAEVSSIDLYS